MVEEHKHERFADKASANTMFAAAENMPTGMNETRINSFASPQRITNQNLNYPWETEK